MKPPARKKRVRKCYKKIEICIFAPETKKKYNNEVNMKNTSNPLANKCLAAVLFSVMLFSLPIRLSAQSKQDSIIAYFDLLKRIPSEKLYLHLDKPFYGAGEKIWLKGYLVNGVTHQNESKSNFIITELVNRTDSVLQRKKIRRDSLGFHNAFTLPPTLPAGDYYLRGYSNWMLNEDPDFFYYRNLRIGNSIDNTVLATIEYQEADADNVVAKINFLNNTQTPYADIKVKYRYVEGGKVRDKGQKKTDAYGGIYLPLPQPKKSIERRIELEFDDPQYICQKTFYLPVLSKDFDVTFFPEGGGLIAIDHQNIAFKAQGADGLSREVTGHLFNVRGDTLNSLHSDHDGMGTFRLNPAINDTYYALFTSSDGVTKRFDLPTIGPIGVNLSMIHHKQEIRYEIQKTAATQWPEELFLVAHTRGILKVLKPVDIGRLSGRLNDSILNEGITHFLLVDGSGRPLSERLVFTLGKNAPQWQITTDKESYGKREKVSMQISAKEYSGAPLAGTFSLSITDRRSVPQDSLADNIVSNLLLTSDLKGHIENPGYYFLNQNVRTSAALDLVMLTHGWRRHKTDHILQPYIPRIDHFIEGGQIISGKIKGLFGNDIKNGAIYVLSPQSGILEMATTNENGEFLVNTSFRDSTSFVIQARSKKGFAGVDILMDKPLTPPTRNKAPFPNTMIPTQMDDYLLSTREKYYLEGGMRVFNLKEVLVTAKRRSSSSTSSLYVGVNDYTVGSERLEKSGVHTALEAVSRLPGITIKNRNEIYVRNNSTQPIIVIDDVTYQDDASMLEFIQSDEIESLSLIRDASANIFGAGGAGGAIVITLKNPMDLPSKPAPGIITYKPLGYCDPIEFYHPTYDTPQKVESTTADLRTTIYWNPELQLDANGTVTIEYYTPDSTAPQEVVIEGVSTTGTVCRVMRTI